MVKKTDNALKLFGSMISAKIKLTYVLYTSGWLRHDEIQMVLVVSEKMNWASDGLKYKFKI
jgi:hypothetical protein